MHRQSPPLAPGAAPLRCVFARFDALGVHALHDALALRCRVFILEQGAYQDPDDADKRSWHLLAYQGEQLVACLRIVDPGARFDEASIGRVVTSPEWRRRGLGRWLVREALAHCEQLWPRQSVRISAQAQLQDFYAELGFAAVGDVYQEDNIAHIAMLRRPQHQETA